jgi:nitroimidazol reductase NimA-like FMN-containing flavoprotein (pyridoxamine 5'-phosphate oxidase superfamily)
VLPRVGSGRSVADPVAPAAAQAAALPYGMSELPDAECRALLHRQRLCVISLVEGDRPYAVPVFYGFDGETIYLGVMEGRKTRALDANEHVCIVVTEVAPDDTWRSVIVEGVARVLTDPEERELAVAALIAHNRQAARRPSSGGDTGGDTGAESPRRRHAGGRILRIERARMTGRKKR